MAVCRRERYDKVVNREISDLVHKFRPHRFVKGVSNAVKGCSGAYDRDLQFAQDIEAGGTMLVTPSADTPLTTLAFANLVSQVGFQNL